MSNLWFLLKQFTAAFDTPFWEGLKTVLRPLIFAFLTAIVEYLLSWLKVAHLGSVVVLIATIILTDLDSYLHQKAKKVQDTGLPQGILPL